MSSAATTRHTAMAVTIRRTRCGWLDIEQIKANRRLMKETHWFFTEISPFELALYGQNMASRADFASYHRKIWRWPLSRSPHYKSELTRNACCWQSHVAAY